jgi:hypothetical protein
MKKIVFEIYTFAIVVLATTLFTTTVSAEKKANSGLQHRDPGEHHDSGQSRDEDRHPRIL